MVFYLLPPNTNTCPTNQGLALASHPTPVPPIRHWHWQATQHMSYQSRTGTGKPPNTCPTNQALARHPTPVPPIRHWHWQATQHISYQSRTGTDKPPDTCNTNQGLALASHPTPVLPIRDWHWQATWHLSYQSGTGTGKPSDTCPTNQGLVLASQPIPVLPIRDFWCLCLTEFPHILTPQNIPFSHSPYPFTSSLPFPIQGPLSLFTPSPFLISHPSIWGIVLLY